MKVEKNQEESDGRQGRAYIKGRYQQQQKVEES